MLIPVNREAIDAIAVDGEVVLVSRGRGAPLCAAFTPEAVLASLEQMRSAAERAIQQQKEPAFRGDDAEPDER